MSTQTTKDPANPYTPKKGNDKGAELVQIVIDWYRGNRNMLSSTEVTNVATAITAVLNETSKV